MNEPRLRRPAEGWLAVALVALMVLVVGAAIDDPGWVNSHGELTDSLPLLALFGAAVGFAGPKLGWNRWTTHLVGALLAALVIPVMAGWADQPGSSIGEAFQATASGTVNAYLDVTWRGEQFTSEQVHYILTLGIIVWGTAQFASYAVFGHHRPLNAVVALALLLLANMALIVQSQLPHLVLFTGAALFLLVTMHVFDERATWLRRRIGDPGAVSGLYLRGGTVFIVLSLVGSLFLTDRAASAPLAGVWADVDRQLYDVGEALGRLFPVGGEHRGGGAYFGDTAQIRGRWRSDPGVAFRASLPDTEAGTHYWRASTYDRFQLGGFVRSGLDETFVAAGEPLLTATREEADPTRSREVDITISVEDFRGNELLSPATPLSVGADARVELLGDGRWFSYVNMGGVRNYTLTAEVLNDQDTSVISQNLLRAASRDYPSDMPATYTEVPEGAIGPAAAALLDEIRATVTRDDPFDLAFAMEQYLRTNDSFEYSPDVTDSRCDDPSVVECFATERRGYCQHYAATMAVLMRAAYPENPVPTRFVQGFLPGEIAGRGEELVRNSAAHAWVEVFFPGYGWVPFDPTRSVAVAAPLLQGPPVAGATIPPASRDPLDPNPLRRQIGSVPEGGPGALGGGNRPPDAALLVTIGALGALLLLALVVVAWLRGPRGEVSPETAWSSLTRGASRMGFARRPTQTVYEYADALGELVPVARGDLRTVADAKVETTYARVRLGGDRLQAVRDATRRLRVSLLRLVGRRVRGLRRR